MSADDILYAPLFAVLKQKAVEQVNETMRRLAEVQPIHKDLELKAMLVDLFGEFWKQ